MAGNNSTSCSSTSVKPILPYMYSMELCVALLGNIFALCMLMMKERKNWHTGVVFSCNLAISDILYVLTFPLIIISKDKKWNFGEPVCKLERFLFACNLYVSIYFIMCISVLRYLAIVHPFFARKHVHPKHAKIVSVLVWIIVAILSSPVLKYAALENNRCKSFSGAAQDKKYIYRIYMAVVGCLIPFLITFSSYFGVIRVVLRNSNIKTLEKKKVALIVGTVCLIYIFSFVPYHIMQLWHFSLKEKGARNCGVQNAYQVSKALTGINMCIHPILYMAVFDSIRTFCIRGNSDEVGSTAQTFDVNE